ncbi:MAG: hypothetical protein IKZ47_01115 [Clostridia bacterium]|nr:hypothetical protein [Clostridia bacterium]
MKRVKLFLAPALLILAVILIVAGILGGGFADLLNKARMICYECIGIG